MAQHQKTTQTETRLERGRRALEAIDGQAGQKVIDALADISPDFANYLFEFPFGDINFKFLINLETNFPSSTHKARQ